MVDRGTETFRIVTGRRAAKTKTRRRTLDFELTDKRLLSGWTWEWQGPGRQMRLRAGGSPRPSTRVILLDTNAVIFMKSATVVPAFSTGTLGPCGSLLSFS